MCNQGEKPGGARRLAFRRLLRKVCRVRPFVSPATSGPSDFEAPSLSAASTAGSSRLVARPPEPRVPNFGTPRPPGSETWPGMSSGVLFWRLVGRETPVWVGPGTWFLNGVPFWAWFETKGKPPMLSRSDAPPGARVGDKPKPYLSSEGALWNWVWFWFWGEKSPKWDSHLHGDFVTLNGVSLVS